MRACEYLICDAPWPPSINELKSLVKIGNKYQIGKSSAYKRYQKKVFNPWFMAVRQKGAIDFGDRIIAWYVLCPPRVNCDVDNFTKCFHDCLEAAEAFANDRDVMDTRQVKGPRVSGGLLRCFIANERHRERLQADFEQEYATAWMPQRDGPILRLNQPLRIRRVVTD